jgi:Zn-dependent oligopeptidases
MGRLSDGSQNGQDRQNAEKYINDLVTGIQPKFDSEIAELQKLKAADTNDPNAKIMVWDWRYYSNQRDKQKYAVDKEALRAYFPFQKVLDGMFNIYQSIFGLKFEKVVAPYKWIDDLQLYLVTDSATGEPLGMFYLDMFPREGKFNHFAQFDIISGKLLPNGKYQRPTVALLCNFPPASGDAPSLMTHQDVETLFHEFGHALHSIVTRATYGRFAGTNVPGDFVEAPSQMLQNWVWERKCWILSLPITAIRPKKFPQKSSRSSTTRSWQMPACFIDASSRSLHSILLCTIHIPKRCHTIRGDIEPDLGKSLFAD